MTLQLLIVLILLGGWLSGRLCSLAGLPGMLGMTLWGLALGFFGRDLVPQVFWDLVPFLKSLALIVILLRAGLGIRFSTLKKVGGTSLRMAFLPSLLEASVLTVLFHLTAGFGWAVSAMAGLILSAVSPAVVVPAMLSLNEEGYGSERDVPSMVLAGASLDNVFVITVFTLFLGFAKGEEVNLVKTLLMVPWSLVLGILPALGLGFALVWFFQRFYSKVRATEKTLLLLGLCIMLVQIGDWTHTAALLGVMTLGFVLLARAETAALELSAKLGKLWVFSEIVLFVIIGMSVRPDVALRAGPVALPVIFGGLAARSIGVLLATAGSALNRKERLFSILAYVPKATVQAALGAVPLQEGIAGGELILAYAVLAILVTAPLGLIGIRAGGRRLLHIRLKGEAEWVDSGR